MIYTPFIHKSICIYFYYLIANYLPLISPSSNSPYFTVKTFPPYALSSPSTHTVSSLSTIVSVLPPNPILTIFMVSQLFFHYPSSKNKALWSTPLISFSGPDFSSESSWFRLCNSSPSQSSKSPKISEASSDKHSLGPMSPLRFHTPTDSGFSKNFLPNKYPTSHNILIPSRP